MKIIWAVRTGNETDRPIEELKNIVRSRNENFLGISFRGKRDMCLLARERKVSGYEAVSNLCNLYREKCQYYKNLDRTKFEMPKEPLLFSQVLRMAEELRICPYFLQLRILEIVDLVSLSYNYILSPIGWVIRRYVPFRKSILVIDEAHNIQTAVMNVNSDSISILSVRRAIKEASTIMDFPPDLADSLKFLAKIMSKMRDRIVEDDLYDPEALMKEVGLSKESLQLLVKFGEKIARRRAEQGKSPRSYLSHIGRFFLTALDSRDVDGIFSLATREGENLKLELVDMRCSEVLKYIWEEFRSVIFMSGTLSPISAFSEVAGVNSCESFEMRSFVDRRKVKTALLKGVSTKGEQLSTMMKDRYLASIKAFLSFINGNVAIFTSSYRIQGCVLGELVEIANKLGFILFSEREGMSGHEARAILESIKKAAYRGDKVVLVAPMGGRFSEGIDLPGKELIGAYIMGIPFDRLTKRTQLYIGYYTRLYGARKGRYYAYVVPAMRKVSQAIGRVIRSEEDYGTFVLGDERFSKPLYN
ncbi:MAG: helicase C-terminal domain-containing protein, partial [Candidatus Methanodesulfokora sp.]